VIVPRHQACGNSQSGAQPLVDHGQYSDAHSLAELSRTRVLEGDSMAIAESTVERFMKCLEIGYEVFGNW
jgi:hypothetical protein